MALGVIVVGLLSIAIASVWPLTDPLASTDWLASPQRPYFDVSNHGPLAMAFAGGGAATIFGLIFVATQTSIHKGFFWYEVSHGRSAVVRGLIMSVVGITLLTYGMPVLRVHLRDSSRLRQWEAAHPHRPVTLEEAFGRRLTRPPGF